MARGAQRTVVGAAVLALALGLGAAPALAGPNDAAAADLNAARQAFNEGKELEKQNSWAEALDKFKRVAEVKMTPQVRFHMALCEENLGRLVSAINGFDLATEEAKRAGSVAAEVAANAPARASALRLRVPSLRLNLRSPLGRSVVLLDGAPVPAAELGTDRPVDPGAHAVEVQLDGKVTSHKDVTLAEKGSETVDLDIEAPVAVEVEVPAPAPAPRPSRVPAVVAGVIGVAGLGAAGVFFGLRAASIATIRSHCRGQNDTFCDPRDEATASSGRTDQTLGFVTGGVGVAGVLACGVLLIVTSGKSGDAKPAEPKASFFVAPTPGGVRFAGTF